MVREKEVLAWCGGGLFVAGGGQFFRCSSGSFDLAHRPTRSFYSLPAASAAHTNAARACGWGKSRLWLRCRVQCDCRPHSPTARPSRSFVRFLCVAARRHDERFPRSPALSEPRPCECQPYRRRALGRICVPGRAASGSFYSVPRYSTHGKGNPSRTRVLRTMCRRQQCVSWRAVCNRRCVCHATQSLQPATETLRFTHNGVGVTAARKHDVQQAFSRDIACKAT